MKVALSDDDQKKLRENNIISIHEVAYIVGDLYIAENVLNSTRRPISVAGLLTENTGKKILKG
tara:strand:+ start:920 stop:1108 length:189 start_codon:yes stop_codon:yes gene_type:complete